MIDSHLHLDDPQFESEVAAVIGRAESAGIKAKVTAGVDLESSRAAVSLAERYVSVYAAVGFHPHDAVKMRAGDLRELRTLAKHPKVVAIGEIGLDYYRDHSPREVQRRVFQEQLELAAELGLPIVVHSRETSQETYQALSEWSKEAKSRYAGLPLGMLHCFSGDLAAALRYAELGFFISLAGPVTYPNARKTREVAAGVPLDRLLTETDAPYLPPQGRRGQRNEPAYLCAIIAQVACLRGMESTVVASATAHNATALFRLPPEVA